MADDKNKTDDQELVAVVDDEVDGTAASADESESKEKDADDESDVEEADDEEGSEADGEEVEAKGDARVATDDAADNTTTRDKRRETGKERRARQKAHIARREKELTLYRIRNEELERQFSQLSARVSKGEQITISQAISTVEAQIAEAKRLEADAIKAHDGESAVEARDVKVALEGKRDRLLVAKDRAAKVTTTSKTPPPEMRQALSWIEANKDWYDPKGSNEDSALASAIEDRMVKEGKFDPASEEFWQELDKRLIKRGIKKATAADDGEEVEDGEEDVAPVKAAKSNGKAPPKKAGGPKVTIGGEKRTLKANEVYIDPGRKQAMKDAGVWDDPKLRQDMLRRYHAFDRDARASR